MFDGDLAYLGCKVNFHPGVIEAFDSVDTPSEIDSVWLVDDDGSALGIWMGSEIPARVYLRSSDRLVVAHFSPRDPPRRRSALASPTIPCSRWTELPLGEPTSGIVSLGGKAMANAVVAGCGDRVVADGLGTFTLRPTRSLCQVRAWCRRTEDWQSGPAAWLIPMQKYLDLTGPAGWASPSTMPLPGFCMPRPLLPAPPAVPAPDP